MDERQKMIGPASEQTNWEMTPNRATRNETAAMSVRSEFESSYDYDRDDKHLRDYWRVIRKHILLIIGITMLVTVLTAVYMARQPDVYQAQARIQVDFDALQGIGAPGSTVLVGAQGSDLMYFNTQLQILTGPGLMRRVVKTLDLQHNRNFIAPRTVQGRSTVDNLKRMVGLKVNEAKAEDNGNVNEVPMASAVSAAAARDDMFEAKQLAPFVNALQLGFQAEPVRDRRLPVKETRLIDLTYIHPDPQIAAKIVNTVADTFVLQNLERKTETNTSTSDFLSKRIAELQEQIRSGEERLLNYSKEHQILGLDSSQDTVVQRLVTLNTQLLEAQNELKLAESAYRANVTPQALNAQAETSDPKINVLAAKLNELKQQRDQILVEGTEELPEYKTVKQAIDTTEKQLADARKQSTSYIATNYQTRYQAALSRVQSLQTEYNQQRGQTVTQNEAAVNYRIMQQEIETNKGLLAGLLEQAKKNDVVLAGMPNNIHVVDYAVVPDAPVGPRRLHGVGLAFLLSLGFGVGLSFFLNYLDNSMNTAEEVERITGLPALAVIPAVSQFTARRLLPASFKRKRLHSGENGSNGSNGRVAGADYPELLLQTEPNSSLTEAFKQLRTSMLLSVPGRAPKTVLVTSSQPAEGKTTTSVNLAISLAQTGAKVVLVDADMRHPRHHKIFGVANQCGLSDILSSQMSDAEILATVDQHAETSLYVLSAGTVPPNPAELLGAEQMRRLLALLGETFTHIVIDSPPMAVFTDSVILSSIVDGVFLVVHSGKCSRDQVRRAKKTFQDMSIRLFGVVLNSARLSSHDEYYRYYDGNY
jgi:polysaccharide biosynthesis transport protein